MFKILLHSFGKVSVGFKLAIIDCHEDCRRNLLSKKRRHFRCYLFCFGSVWWFENVWIKKRFIKAFEKKNVFALFRTCIRHFHEYVTRECMRSACRECNNIFFKSSFRDFFIWALCLIRFLYRPHSHILGGTDCISYYWKGLSEIIELSLNLLCT